MSQEIISQGEQTREVIAAAAHQLFLEQGYHGTSMRQIASATGLALGGIYNHFDSKEQIFSEVLIAHHPYLDVLPALQAAQGETVEEFVRDAANRLVSNLDERLDFLKLLFIELVEFNGTHFPQIFELFYPEVIGFAEKFTREQTELRDIPGPILVRAFIGMFFSYFMTEMLFGQYLPPGSNENVLEYFIEIFLDGVRLPGAQVLQDSA